MFTLKHIKNRSTPEETIDFYTADRFSVSKAKTECNFTESCDGESVNIDLQAGDRLIVENMNGQTSQIIDI